MTGPSSAPAGLASFHGGHSSFGDGQGTVHEIARTAAQIGLRAFGFTEHFLLPPHQEFSPDGKTPGNHLRSETVGEYVAAVQAAKQEHDGQIEILLGAELEFLRDAQGWTRQRVAQWPFDYLVGSVHYVRYDGLDICIDWDKARTEEALRRAGSPEQLVLDYFDHILDLLDWRLAHVLGHLDLIKIHLEPSQEQPTPAVRAKVQGVLETMRSNGVAMDVNARGLIKPCQSIYPADWILAEAQRIGVPVALGDDSHGPRDVGARLDRAVALLQQAGYNQMAMVHPGGTLELVPLPEC